MSRSTRAPVELVARYERLRSQKVDRAKTTPWPLRLTAANSPSTADAVSNGGRFPSSKVNALVEMCCRLATHPNQHAARNDLLRHGSASHDWGYSAYDEIIEKLTASGIPRHSESPPSADADSDAKKQALFERVRTGQVRVLLGSTAKDGCRHERSEASW